MSEISSQMDLESIKNIRQEFKLLQEKYDFAFTQQQKSINELNEKIILALNQQDQILVLEQNLKSMTSSNFPTNMPNNEQQNPTLSETEIIQIKSEINDLKKSISDRPTFENLQKSLESQQLRQDFSFLEEKFVETYNFHTSSLISQAEQIKDLREMISIYDLAEDHESDSSNDNQTSHLPNDTKRIKGAIMNLQNNIRKQAESDRVVLNCLKYEIKKLKSAQQLSGLEESIDQLRQQISKLEETDKEKIESIQNELTTLQNQLNNLHQTKHTDVSDQNKQESFDGSIDTLKDHLNKLDQNVKSLRHSARSDSEEMQNSIDAIVQCLTHEMKKLKEKQATLSLQLKEKGIVPDVDSDQSSSSLLSELEAKTKKNGNRSKDQLNLPFEEIVPSKLPNGNYLMEIPDEPFNAIKKELYTLECNFVQTANVHATSIENQYKQLAEIKQTLENQKVPNPSLSNEESKSELLHSLKEVKKLKENGQKQQDRIHEIEEMNNRIATIEDYLENQPEIVEIHQVDSEGNSIEENSAISSDIVPHLIETMNSMANEIRIIRDEYDLRDTVRCIKHELKKQAIDKTALENIRQSLWSNQRVTTRDVTMNPIEEINLRLDTIEEYLVNETEEDGPELNTLSDLVSSLVNSMKCMKYEMQKMKKVIAVQNKELMPLKEKLSYYEDEKKKSDDESKELKKALDSIMEQEEIQQINKRLDTIEDYLQEGGEPLVEIQEIEKDSSEEDPTITIGKVVGSLIEQMKTMKEEIDVLQGSKGRDNAIRCLKHELKKLKCQIELQELIESASSDELELPDDYSETIKKLQNEIRLMEDQFNDTITSQTNSIDINSMEIQTLKKNLKSLNDESPLKDKFDQLETLMSVLENEGSPEQAMAIYNFKLERKINQIEKRLDDGEGAQGLRDEIRTMMHNVADISKHQSESIEIHENEINKIKACLEHSNDNEVWEIEIDQCQIPENIKVFDVPSEERLDALEHAVKCIKYELKKLLCESEMQSILQDEISNSMMMTSMNETTTSEIRPFSSEAEEKINRIREELRNLENNFNETANNHTISLDVHDNQLAQIKAQLKNGGCNLNEVTLQEIDEAVNQKLARFEETLQKTKDNLNHLENGYENMQEIAGFMSTRGITDLPFEIVDKHDDDTIPEGEERKALIALKRQVMLKNVEYNDRLDKLEEQLLVPESHKRKAKRFRKKRDPETGEYEYEDLLSEDSENNSDDDSKSTKILTLAELNEEVAELREILTSQFDDGILANLKVLPDARARLESNEVIKEIKENINSIEDSLDTQVDSLKSDIKKIAKKIKEMKSNEENDQEREVRLDVSVDSLFDNNDDLEAMKLDYKVLKEDLQQLTEKVNEILLEKPQSGMKLVLNGKLSFLSNSENSIREDETVENAIQILNRQIQELKAFVLQNQSQTEGSGMNMRLDILDNSSMIPNMDDIDDLKQENQAMKESLEEFKEQINKLNEIISNQQNDSGFELKLVNTSSTFEDDIHKEMEEMKENIEGQYKEIDKITKALKAISFAYESMRAKDDIVNNITERNVEIADETFKLDEMISDYLNKDDFQAEIEIIKNDITEINNAISEMKEEQSKFVNHEALDLILGTHDTSSIISNIETMKSSNDYDQQIDELQEQNENIVKSLRCIKYTLKKLKQKVEDSEFTERSVQIVKLNDNESGLYNHSEVSNDNDNDFEERLNELAKVVEDIHNKQKAFVDQNTLELLLGNENSFDENGVSKNGNLKQINEQIMNLQDSVSDLENEINQIHGNESETKKELEQLKCELIRIAEDDSVPIHLNVDEENINQNDISNVIDDINDYKKEIDQNMNKLEQKFNELKSNLNALAIDKDEHMSFTLPVEENGINEDQMKEIVLNETLPIYDELSTLKDEIQRLHSQINDKSDKSEFKLEEDSLFMMNSEEMAKLIGKLDHSFKCLKHEVKKLKEKSNQKVSYLDNLDLPPESLEDNEVLNTLYQLMKSSYEKTNYSLRCLKHEVKKIKENTETVNEQSEFRIDEKEIDLQYVEDELHDEINQLTYVNRCLKHEIKKLKENQSEINNHLSSIEDKIHELESFKITSNEVEELNDTQNHQEEYEKVQFTLRCLKHEVKKLKETPPIVERSIPLNDSYAITPRDVDEANAENELLELLNATKDHIHQSMKCLKHEVKKLKEFADGLKETQEKDEHNAYMITPEEVDTANEQNNLIDLFTNSFDKLNYSMRCLKHEVKKIKDVTIELKNCENDQTGFEITSHDVEIEQHEAELNDKYESVQYSMKCLKHEVKKIKEESQIIKDELNEIKNKLSEAKNDSNDFEINEKDVDVQNEENEIFKVIDGIKFSIRCLKHEVKKIKEESNIMKDEIEEVKNQTHEVKDNSNDFEIQEKDVDTQNEENELRKDYEQIQFSLRCIKHEVKKLKEESTKIQHELNELNNKEEITDHSNDFEIQEKDVDVENEENELFKVYEQLQFSLRCIKHEVKTIKEESTLIKDELNELKSNKEINEKSNNFEIKEKDLDLENEENELRRDYQQIQYSLRCLKHEVKKMKEITQIVLNQQEIQAKNIENLTDYRISPNDVDDQNQYVEDELHDEINQLTYVNRCLKHEIKKLKENQSEINNHLSSIEDKIHELESFKITSNEVEELNDTQNHQEEYEKVQFTLRCLKHEVKKLKETPPIVERSIPLNDSYAIQSNDVDHTNAENELRDLITNSYDKLVYTNRCLKHEIKKLKDFANDLFNNQQEIRGEIQQLNSYEIDQIDVDTQNELKEYMDKALTSMNNSIKRLQDKIKNFEKEIENVKTVDNNAFSITEKDVDQTNNENEMKQKLNDSFAKLTKDVKCLKHEVKKLKEIDHAIEKEEEIPVNDSFSITEKDMDQINNENEMKQQLNDSIEKLTKDMNCLKHEVKKLKDTDDKQDIRCIKHEIEKLKENQKDQNDSFAINEDDINQIHLENELHQIAKSIDDINQQMKCLKHEVKKLKDSPIEKIEREISFEIDQKEVDVESEFKEMLTSSINSINRDINCLKHEVKKLKENEDKQENEKDNSFEITEREVEIENEFNEMLTSSLNSVNRDIKCLKHEIKKLKEIEVRLTQKTENQPIANENEIKSMLESSLNSVDRDIKCIKYEVKVLKESSDKEDIALLKREVEKLQQNKQPLPVTKREVQKEINNENEMLSSSLNSVNRDIQCLKHEVKKLKEMNDKEEIASLKGEVEKLQQINNPNELLSSSINSLNRDIKCLKHEVKKLKENEANSNINRISTESKNLSNDVDHIKAENELLDLYNSLKHNVNSLQDEMKLLQKENSQLKARLGQNEKVPQLQNAQIDPELRDMLTNSFNTINYSMSCLKHEVKKLKKESPTKSERNNELEDQIEAINKELQQYLNNNEVISQMKDQFQCMKYEIKKIKQSLDNDNLEHQQTDLPYDQDELEVIKHSINSIKSQMNEINHSIKCLKYETKNLKLNKQQIQYKTRNGKMSEIDIKNELNAIRKEFSELKEMNNESDSDSSSNEEINSMKAELNLLQQSMKMNQSPTVPSNVEERLEAMEEKYNELKNNETQNLNKLRQLAQKVEVVLRNQSDIDDIKANQEHIRSLISSEKKIKDEDLIATFKLNSSSSSHSRLDEVLESIELINRDIGQLKKNMEQLKEHSVPQTPTLGEEVRLIPNINDLTVSELQDKVKALEDKVAYNEQHLTSPPASADSPRIEQLQESIKSITETVNRQTQYIKQYKTKISSLQTSLASASNEIKQLKAQLNDHEEIKVF